MKRTALTLVPLRPFAHMSAAPLASLIACVVFLIVPSVPAHASADADASDRTRNLRVASGCVIEGRAEAGKQRLVVTVRKVGEPGGEGGPAYEPVAFTLVQESSNERVRFPLTEAFSGTSRGQCLDLDGSTAYATGYSAVRIGTDDKGRKLAVSTSEARDGGPCGAPATRTFGIEFEGVALTCARIHADNRDAAFFDGRSIERGRR